MEQHADIIKDLKQGKEKALTEIYKCFFHALCAFGYRFVKNEEVVADIVQEIFIKIWDKRKDFETVYALRSFMYLSVRNACFNYNRDTSKTKIIAISDVITESVIEEDGNLIIEEEVHRLIQNEVEQLPEGMKKVFNLTLMDMSIPEISKVLNISENTVRNQRARAREILRDKLHGKIQLFFLFI